LQRKVNKIIGNFLKILIHTLFLDFTNVNELIPPKSSQFIMTNDSLFKLFMLPNLPRSSFLFFWGIPFFFCTEVLIMKGSIYQQLMMIPKTILTYWWSRLLNVLLFLIIKQKELHSFKPTDLLLKTKLILGNYFSSKKLSITKNNQQELEFTNDTKEYCGGLSYLDFVLNPSINYVVHVQLQ